MNELPDSIFEEAAADPQIQQRVKQIINSALDSIEYFMKHGTPEQRSLWLRQILPGLGKQLVGSSVDDEIVKMRKELDEMYTRLREDGPPQSEQEPEDDLEVAEDAPNVIRIK